MASMIEELEQQAEKRALLIGKPQPSLIDEALVAEALAHQHHMLDHHEEWCNRSYPEPDEEWRQPSDTFLAPFLGDIYPSRAEIPPYLLEIWYWRERVHGWIEAHTTPTRLTLYDLTLEWQERSLLREWQPEPNENAEWRRELDGAAEHQEPAIIEATNFDALHNQRATLVRQWAWKDKGLLPSQFFLRPLIEPPTWLLDVLQLSPSNTALVPSLVQQEKRLRVGRRLPNQTPQYTGAEFKALLVASADGPHLQRWVPVEDEDALRHAIDKGAPLEVKFRYPTLIQSFQVKVQDDPVKGHGNQVDQARQKAYGILKDALRDMGLTANMTFHICMAALLEKPYPEIALDDLITAIGLDPRSSEERVAMRRQIWHWLRVFSCWEIIGKRKGTYRDPTTKQLIDLQATESLFHISGRQDPEGELPVMLCDNNPPLIVKLARSAWLDSVAGNDSVLTYFGDVRKLAAIPGGKPSGAWARAIGMALNHLWREEATRTKIAKVGDEQKLTTIRKPFTRRELLTLFLPQPSAEEILGGDHPKRAQGYWRDSIDLLQDNRHPIIGFIQQLDPDPVSRRGWSNAWLDVRFDVRPTPEGIQVIAKLAGRAEAGRKKRERKARS